MPLTGVVFGPMVEILLIYTPMQVKMSLVTQKHNGSARSVLLNFHAQYSEIILIYFAEFRCLPSFCMDAFVGGCEGFYSSL